MAQSIISQSKALPFLTRAESLDVPIFFSLILIRLDTTRTFDTLDYSYYQTAISKRGAAVKLRGKNKPGLGSNTLSEFFCQQVVYSYPTIMPKYVYSSQRVEPRLVTISSARLDPTLLFYLFNIRVSMKEFKRKVGNIGPSICIESGEVGAKLLQGHSEYRDKLERYLCSKDFREKSLIKKLNSITKHLGDVERHKVPSLVCFLPIFHDYIDNTVAEETDDSETEETDDSETEETEGSEAEETEGNLEALKLVLSPGRLTGIAGKRATVALDEHNQVFSAIRNYVHSRESLSVEDFIRRKNLRKDVTIEWILGQLDKSGRLTVPLKAAFTRFITANITRLLDYDLGCNMFIEGVHAGGESLNSVQDSEGLVEPDPITKDLFDKVDEIARNNMAKYPKIFEETDSPPQGQPCRDDFPVAPVMNPVVTPTFPDLAPGVALETETVDRLFSKLTNNFVRVFPSKLFLAWHNAVSSHWVTKEHFKITKNTLKKYRQTVWTNCKAGKLISLPLVRFFVFPLNHHEHWSSLVFDNETGLIHHLDSILAPNFKFQHELKEFLSVANLVSKDKLHSDIKFAVEAESRPKQDYTIPDCAVYAFLYTRDLLTLGADNFSFKSEDIPAKRAELLRLLQN